ncbi:MAG: Kelch repeat-containing protein [Candidatus Limnocylindria bacterium]
MRRSQTLVLAVLALVFLGGFELGRAQAAPAPESWATVAELSRPRAFARAVPLVTGEVLVLGGLDPLDPQVTSFTSELFDPRTRDTEVLPDPILGRLNQSVTVGWGDRVVVAGGTEWRVVGWSAVDRVEVFNPYSRDWYVADSLRAARSDHAAAALSDGRILVVAGNDGPRLLASAEIYDPAADRWTSVAPLPRPRTQATAATLPDGRVLVVGGIDRDGAETNTTFIYDAVSDEWSVGPDMRYDRLTHAMVTLANGDVLVIGGQGAGSGTAERYDFRLGRFVHAGALIEPRLVAQAARLPDGRVLLAGGLSSVIHPHFDPLVHAEVWDPADQRWHPLAEPPSPRAYGVVVATDEGAFRISGSGFDEETYASIERFGTP